MSKCLETLVAAARSQDASDLHLEPGLPAAVRIRGSLRTTGEPLTPRALQEIAHDLIGPEQWERLTEKRSYDLSKTVAGVRCRINVMQTSRGVGLAIRLLASFQATLETLNLHPDLRRLVQPVNGLAIISGPTGSGKSSTLAALIQEINLTEARHVITIESPIEYTFRPRRAFIRQREVGRDTPSFEQALLDALREDPDVLMVGELREPETMRLTLNAAETGHLVLTTVHSATCAEALQRIVSAFPSEIQGNVCAQLADSLVGVVAQRLRHRADLNLRVPECEILFPTTPVKAFIRNREFFKIMHVIETGAEHAMWTFDRYQSWMAKRARWHIPGQNDEAPDEEPSEIPSAAALPPLRAPAAARPAAPSKAPVKPGGGGGSGPIEIEPVEGGLTEVLKRLE
jgi:twitching motility protein PilT